jgi:transposase
MFVGSNGRVTPRHWKFLEPACQLDIATDRLPGLFHAGADDGHPQFVAGDQLNTGPPSPTPVHRARGAARRPAGSDEAFLRGIGGRELVRHITRPLQGTVSERVEVRVERRRWLAGETLEPGAAAKVVAERHGIGTEILYPWCKQMLTTALAGYVQVQVARKALAPMPAAPADSLAEPARARDATARGVIEVQWSSGVRVGVPGSVDVKLLRSVLAQLSSR